MTCDLIVTNAQIWTPAPSPHTAIAVSHGRVVMVGHDTDVLTIAGPKTQRLDARGGAVLPGFHDGHIHALAGGIQLLRCDLSQAHSFDGYVRIISAAAAATDSQWLIGSGWFGDVFEGGFPRKELLDEIEPDKLVVLSSHDAHGVWVNSAALAAAGITAETPDPPAGRILRDTAGEPTGMLIDAAGELITRLLPTPDAQELRAAMLTAQEYLFSLGITSWHDAILGRFLTLPDCIPTYLETIADGSLRASVTGSVWWPSHLSAVDAPQVLDQVERCRAGGLNVQSVKIMQDGICENYTGALKSPYHGVRGEITGQSVIHPDELARIVMKLDRAGLSVHFHGVGDRAVAECLDAVATARAHNGPGQVHQIAHLDLVDPTDLPRFSQLNVAANLQPLWARADQEIVERKLPLLGAERSQWHFPFASLERANARLAMGSDWPVTSPNPLWGLFTACTRTAPPDDPHALNMQARLPMQPEQRLSVESALRAYTLGAAETSGVANQVGRLAPGLRADIVILSGPILTAESFAQTRVAHTLVAGNTVYSTH